MTDFRETGALLAGSDAEPVVVYWHEPAGRTAGALPDDHVLWERIWEQRHDLIGFAHTHPGGGTPPAPSHEDLTTFAAIERALGRVLTWWIINTTHAVRCDRYDCWLVMPTPTPRLHYAITAVASQPWMDELRRRSNT